MAGGKRGQIKENYPQITQIRADETAHPNHLRSSPTSADNRSRGKTGRWILLLAGGALAAAAFALSAHGVEATGGTTTNYVCAAGANWTAHSFTAAGTNNLRLRVGGKVEVLVVGGGGGGGRNQGGGGGGGAVILTNLALASGVYKIVVGPGGAAGDSGWSASGGTSSFHEIIARGGSGGLSRTHQTSTRVGGNSGNELFTGGNGSVPGNKWGAGGGAGNGGNGESPTDATARAGNGGPGTVCDFSGTPVGYGGGGGGGNKSGTAQGMATNGGGNGGMNSAGSPGTPNTGGGAEGAEGGPKLIFPAGPAAPAS